MPQNHKIVIQKFQKFNEWEKINRQGKSAAAKLEEFKELFELTFLLPGTIRQRERKKHLKELIRMQEMLEEIKGGIKK